MPTPRLFDRIVGETRGVDGETGQAIDTFGEDHARWRARVRDSCPDTACLTRAYTARIAQVRRDWSRALPDTPALRHVVNARFGFSVDVPADLVAEPPPDNGDGQAFRSADGHLHLTVSGLNDVLDQDLDAVVAADRKTCLRQPPEYAARKPGWIVLSCTTAAGILYRKPCWQAAAAAPSSPCASATPRPSRRAGRRPSPRPRPRCG